MEKLAFSGRVGPRFPQESHLWEKMEKSLVSNVQCVVKLRGKKKLLALKINFLMQGGGRLHMKSMVCLWVNFSIIMIVNHYYKSSFI